MKKIKLFFKRIVELIFGKKYELSNELENKEPLEFEELKNMKETTVNEHNTIMLHETNLLIKWLRENKNKISDVIVYWGGDYYSTGESVFDEDFRYLENIGGIVSSSWSKPMIEVHDLSENVVCGYTLPYTDISGNVMVDLNATIKDMNERVISKLSDGWGDF